MSIRKIRAGRVPTVTAAQYVGEKGTIFWNESTGAFRLSDGHTAGGITIGIVTNSVVTENILPDQDNVFGIGDPTHRWNHLHLGDGGIYFDGAISTPQTVPYLPGAVTADIVPYPTDGSLHLGSSTNRWGDLWIGKASLHMQDEITGSDVAFTVNNGTIYLNGVGNLAIGNLIIRDTTLQSLTTNLDINVGETNDTGFFYVRRKAQFDNTSFGDTEAMVSINASGGDDPLTNFPDTVVQLTGRPNKTSRLIQRAYGSDPQIPANNSYAVWGSYAARGTVASPLPLQAGDILARISANGYGKTGGTGLWGSGGTRIESVALENFTTTAKGSKINFYTTPVGQTTSQNVASITDVGILAKSMSFQSDVDLGNGKKQSKAGIEWDQKGVVNGVASLDNNGKLDAAQIPDALTGAIVFKGTWDAYNNVPELSNSLPLGLDTGWEYIVEVSGTRNIGDGPKSFLAGDFVIFDGTHWKQVPSGNAFVSLSSGGHITVNQTTGAMTLGSDATSSATNSTIVARDSSGNFSANTITAALNGNANTANSATSAGKSTNLVGGVLGSMPYQSAPDTTLFVAPNTTLTKKFFTQTGTGTVGIAPSWDTLSKSDVGLSAVENTALSTSTHYIGTTSIQYNRASASQTLNGVSIDGNAGTVTNGVYTSGDQTIGGTKTFSSTITGSVSGNAGTVTNGFYTSSSFNLGTTSIAVNRASGAQSLTGISIDGNAGTVTNGVYTSGSYSDPSWLTISKSKVGLSAVENTALSTWAGTSNITTVGTLTSGTIGSGFTAIANARLANSTIQVNGVTLTLGDTGKTITADAGTLTGTTLNSTVVTSSLTALGGMSTIKAGTISATFTVAKNTPISTHTFTVSGLTTSHKIIITSNTAMPDETYFIPAAWVSATNTVSIQIAHTGGAAFTATFNISYFAWV